MMKRKDLVKVIKGKEVFYKLNEILELDELREEYSKKYIKDTLAPYAVKIKGLGASKWIREDYLYKVNFLSKTVHTNIDNFIVDDIKNNTWGLNLALAFTRGNKVLGESYKEEQIKKIKQEAIENAKNLKDRDIKNIEESLEEIEEIEKVNKGLEQYNAEIVWEIRDNFRLEKLFIAPNLVEDIYSVKELDKWIYLEGDEAYYIDEDEREVRWKLEGDYIYDKDMSILENVLRFIDNGNVEVDKDWSDFWCVSGENISMTLEIEDLYKILVKEPIIKYNKEDLVVIKEQLGGINEEAREYVEAKYSVDEWL